MMSGEWNAEDVSLKHVTILKISRPMNLGMQG